MGDSEKIFCVMDYRGNNLPHFSSLVFSEGYGIATDEAIRIDVVENSLSAHLLFKITAYSALFHLALIRQVISIIIWVANCVANVL